MSALDRLGTLGASAEEDELAELRRRVLILATAGIAAVSPIWIAVYALLGLWVAAAIPLLWVLATIGMLAAQARRPRLVVFRNVELAMMLVFPFLLQWTLGGFAPGSAVALWALSAPLGAVFFIGARPAVPWFAAYLVLLALSAALEPVLPAPADIPDAIQVGFFLIDLGAVSVTVFALVVYFVRAREAEHERSEALLLNVLPRPVAQRLKRSPGVIADAYPEASVLFADIVGFTSLTERLDPERLIALLDRIFTRWDALAARHGLEKIKTVGDEYMAVAGVPRERADHARAAVAMALEMPAELAACTDAETGPLELRIGIDSGPVVAGVIGRSKFIYDLWGDTVNTASRMESTGEPGLIQVTSRTAARLGSATPLRARENVDVKGKGAMATYVVDVPGAGVGRGERAEGMTTTESPRGPSVV